MWGIIESFVEDIRTINGGVFPTEEDRNLKLLVVTKAFLDKNDINILLLSLTSEKKAITKQNLKLLGQTLSYILDCEGLGELMSNSELKQLIINGLMSSNADLRKLSVDKLLKKSSPTSSTNLITSEEKNNDVKTAAQNFFNFEDELDQEILNLLIKNIFTKDLYVNKKSELLLHDLILNYENKKIFFELISLANILTNKILKVSASESEQSEFGEILNKIENKDISIYLIRLISLIVKISNENSEFMKKENYKFLFKILKSEDILLILNLVHILFSLTLTKKGFIICKSNNIHLILKNYNKSSFFKDAALRLLAVFSSKELYFNVDENRSITETFVEVVKSTPMSLNYINVIGSYGGSCLEAFKILESEKIKIFDLGRVTEEVLISSLNSLSYLLSLGNYNFKPMTSFAHLFQEEEGAENLTLLETKKQRNQEGVSLADLAKISKEKCKKMFINFFAGLELTGMKPTPSNLVDVLFYFLMKPVEDLQNVSLKVLRSVCLQAEPWGINLIYSRKKYVNILLDRTLNISKITKEWRFSVLEAVYQHPKGKELRVLQDKMERIRGFLREGPFRGPKTAVDKNAVQAQVKLEML